MSNAVRMTPRAELLVAPNPGPMTLEGTNTWLLSEPGSSYCVVVDPGPDDAGHIRAIVDAADESLRTIEAVLLTHGHPDHAAGAPRLSKLCGARVLATDPAHGAALGTSLDIDGLMLDVVATPGHSSDSVCFVIRADRAVLTGDHVLGRGTTVVEHPDGRMGDYLASLGTVRALHAARLLPGHGPVVDDPETVLEHYVRHREKRLDELCAAIAGGSATPADLVRTIYRDVDPRLRPVAELTVRAGLELLVERGQVRRDDGGYRPV